MSKNTPTQHMGKAVSIAFSDTFYMQNQEERAWIVAIYPTINLQGLKIPRNLAVSHPVVLLKSLDYLLTRANSYFKIAAQAMGNHGVDRHKPATSSGVVNDPVLI